MSALEFAKQTLAKQKMEQEKEKARKLVEAQENERYRRSLEGQMDKALNEFHGVSGITCKGNSLFKNNREIARFELKYETWTNPNYDYHVEESGIVLRYYVYDTYGNLRISSSFTEESFGRDMSIHLD